MTKNLILLATLDLVAILNYQTDANLAPSRFQIRIPIPTYFCKNIFYRRYCTVIFGSCQTSNLHAKYEDLKDI